MKAYFIIIFALLLQVSLLMGQENNANLQENIPSKKNTHKLCGEAHRQSPIQIIKGKKKTHQISFNYMKSHEVVLNLGHTVELKYDEGSNITLDKKNYQLIQMHFHTPSEHWIKKKKFIMEAHLVHQSSDGNYAVVAVLFEEGIENDFLSKFIKDIPEKKETETEKNQSIQIADILPKEKAFFMYSGSLTTPPYTEGVRWLIFQMSQKCTLQQSDAIKKVEGFNARNLQKLNHRKVEIFKNQ